MQKNTRSSGFTLVELLMALLIAGIVMGAVFTSFNSQHRTYLAQDQAVQVQQSARAAMDFMARDIRMAGFDPRGSAGATIISADSDTFAFGFDDDQNGDCSGVDPAERVSYELYPSSGHQRLGRKNLNTPSPTNQGVADYIDRLEFYYTMADGSQKLNPTAAEYGDIRAVQVTILARAATADPSYSANIKYTTPGGQDWEFNDNIRRRLLTRRIECRNMGM